MIMVIMTIMMIMMVMIMLMINMMMKGDLNNDDEYDYVDDYDDDNLDMIKMVVKFTMTMTITRNNFQSKWLIILPGGVYWVEIYHFFGGNWALWRSIVTLCGPLYTISNPHKSGEPLVQS